MKALYLTLIGVTLLYQSGYSVSLTTIDATNNSVDATFINNEDTRPKLRLGFTAVNTLHRQLLLTVDENATAGIDWAYDAEYYESDWDDMYWLLEGLRFTIQGTNVVDETIVLPLGFHTNDDGMNTVKIDSLENFYEDLGIFIHDKELDVYHSLRDNDYHFYAEAGTHLERFNLVFSIPQETLAIPENEISSLNFYYSNAQKNIVVKNPKNKKIKQILVYNNLGQPLINLKTNNTFGEQLYAVPHLSSGAYIIVLSTELGTRTKKVLIN